MNKLILKPGREKSVKRRHPWVFSGAIAKVEGKPESGDTVEIRSADGEPLALAAYSPHSQIRARAWTWTACEIDASFIRTRVHDAAQARSALRIGGASDALLLIHGEA